MALSGSLLNARTSLSHPTHPARTDFDFASGDDGEVDQSSRFDDEIKRSEIRDASLRYIEEDLSEAIQSINVAKEEKLLDYVKLDAPQYKTLMKYTPEFIDKISPNASKTDTRAGERPHCQTPN